MRAPGHPLFVYDRDGALAGGLWYLHFRLSDQIPDDRRASGLRAWACARTEATGSSHRGMWLARSQ